MTQRPLISSARTPATASHDDLLMLATNRFCDVHSRDRLGQAQYAEAFELLIGTVREPTRQIVARLLAFCPFTPRNLALHFSREPISLSAPILAHSLQLTQLDMLAIVRDMGPDHAACIAGRPDLGPTLVNALRAMNCEPVDQRLRENEAFPMLANRVEAIFVETELLSQAEPVVEIEVVEEAPIEVVETVDWVEPKVIETKPIEDETTVEPETPTVTIERPAPTVHAQQALLAAAARGGRLDIKAKPVAEAIPLDFGPDMEAAARSGNRQTMGALLQRRFGIDFASAQQVLEDGSGDTLAVALKAADLERGQANRIALLAHPNIGLSVQNATRAVRFYATLETQSCIEAIELWPKAEVKPAVHQPLTADTPERAPQARSHRITVTPVGEARTLRQTG